MGLIESTSINQYIRLDLNYLHLTIKMLTNPSEKYTPFPQLYLPNRKWPNKALTKPPRWLSTDLRDGNQALAQPMDAAAKLRYFQFLLQLGYKEIEISYPSASATEYDFTRQLITTGAIPDDVTIQVMAPCREDLIRRTIEAVRGARSVILHIHVSTSDCFREVVFNLTEREMIDLAVRCTELIRSLTKDSPDPEMAQTEWTLEFTPENFQDTSVEFGLSICEAVKSVWQPSVQNQIIFNLTSTVEVAMPNVFADQVEFFCDHITQRDKVCVSLHNHNDRGCAVATAEMSQLAGADRVEGCLFGNGERTGNVDLVTLALNLYTQGVHPGINFGDINAVVDLVEELTKIPVHSRAPYAGKFVFCTFTGTHQDAIRKGYKRRAASEQKLGRSTKWRMPYLPMDPVDLGRKHEAIIRLNAQSGKGGIAWYVNDVFGIDLPRELEIDFTRVVKAYANEKALEITHEMIEDLFRERYMPSTSREPGCLSSNMAGQKRDNRSLDRDADGYTEGGPVRPPSNGHVQTDGYPAGERGEAQKLDEDIWPRVEAAVKKFGFNFEILDHALQVIDSGEELVEATRSAAFVKVAPQCSLAPVWGVAIAEDPVSAALHAVLGAWEKHTLRAESEA
ncbi:uncharacterized protein DSM5745_04536 [Aspergillus mulundensis]|uniref:2-isopropylmalate synthase n=1 Tax=Aspergillus mulundensis TaxID=1810919 RepID=A0A3D8SCZ0_9EURO|nr:Uncharacterized protein DSM5745_04536 [Aspergillus mulundensis]RDW84210.1 Uncharacterized protein DSM5745_04536 [Aspergillus mulundensis]